MRLCFALGCNCLNMEICIELLFKNSENKNAGFHNEGNLFIFTG